MAFRTARPSKTITCPGGSIPSAGRPLHAAQSYNNQSLLATGCYEAEDPGITRFGQTGHPRNESRRHWSSTCHTARNDPPCEAIELSERPIAITHANPSLLSSSAAQQVRYRAERRWAESGGMLGFSLYPHHLKGRIPRLRRCRTSAIWWARTAELMGIAPHRYRL